MKGVVFNIFEDFIVESFDDSTWELILDESGEEEEVFIGPKTYPDEVLFNFIKTAVKLKGLNLKTAERLFGKFAYPKLKEKIPNIVERYSTPEELLFSLDSIIHVEVRKFLEDANPPSFEVTSEGNNLIMKYHSKRNLCYFVEGLLEGLALSFKKKVHYTQTKCTHKGDGCCVFNVQFD